MLILLPPSETKRDGGEGQPLKEILSGHQLQFSELDSLRKKITKAVIALAKDPEKCAEALKLSPKQMGEVARNKAVLVSPTMPAIDRYTGVLYDGLAAVNLSEAARTFLEKNVVIQSSMLGLVGAMDYIPAYRLSFDSKLPLEIGTLKQTWSGPAAIALNKHIKATTPLVLDLRSEGYSALAPLAPAENVFYLRVVTKGENGQLKALNHFNKKGKGEFVRALAQDDETTAQITRLGDLIDWAANKKILLELGKPATKDWPQELNLVVSGTLAKLC